MRVGIVWHAPYPWDVRMEKIINVLTGDGHEVHLVCKAGERMPPFEDRGALRIYRVDGPSVFGSRGLAKLLRAPLPLNPIWYLKALRVFKRAGVDRLVVRDLPMALLAGVLAKQLGVPMFFDMAENYPAALVAYNNKAYKPFLFGNAWLPKQYELLSLKLATHVFVVADEQIGRLVRAGVDREKMSVVMNTPDVEGYMDKARQDPTARNAPDATLLYVGKVDAHRGIEVLVRAMPAIHRVYPSAKLIIVGDGTERKQLERLSAKLGLAASIEFQGWVPFDRVPGLIADSTVCLIPHVRSDHTETTIPNKIFDYMVFAKPVIASDCAPLARIIDDAQCGCVFRSGDSEDLAEKVLRLLVDPNRAGIGENGRRAVIDRYHWRRDAAELLARMKDPRARAETRRGSSGLSGQ